MIYEAYEIVDSNGNNKFIGNDRSKAKVLERTRNRKVCLVVEKIRASSFPSDFTVTKNGVIVSTGLLTTYNNRLLVKAEQAKHFWLTRQHLFK